MFKIMSDRQIKVEKA